MLELLAGWEAVGRSRDTGLDKAYLREMQWGRRWYKHCNEGNPFEQEMISIEAEKDGFDERGFVVDFTDLLL